MLFDTLCDRQTGRVFSLQMSAQNAADELFLSALSRTMLDEDTPAEFNIKVGTKIHTLQLGPNREPDTD